VIQHNAERPASPIGRIHLISAMPVIEGIVRAAATSVDGTAVITNDDIGDVLTALEAEPTSIVVVDLDASFEDGLEVLRIIRRDRTSARPIVLSSRAEAALILEVIRLGARAFVRAPDDLPDLPDVLSRVARGERSVPPGLEGSVALELGIYVRRSRDGAEVDQDITERQREILGLLADGFTISQIGRRLAISPRTVETHVANLYRKLSVRTRLQAIARAASLGMIDLR
jgi:two-component system nitrate/nitrite response regulator NarL